MAYTRTIIKNEKIEKGEVKVCRLLTDKDLYAVVIPNFCKQLHMMTKICNHEYYDSLIATARDFCSDVYNSSVATGIWVDTLDGPVHGVLLTKEDEEVLWTLTEEGVPRKHLLGIANYKYGQKLNLKRDSKMSKKLWVTTDWLLYR